MASFWWIEGRLLFSQVVMIRTHNMLILLLMSIQMNFFVRLSHLSIRHFLLVFMSPAWQFLILNVHCGLSRSSLLLGSARSCGSAGSAMLRCLVGCGSKMDFYWDCFKICFIRKRGPPPVSQHNVLQYRSSAQRFFGSLAFDLRFAVAVASCELFSVLDDQLALLPMPEAKRGLSRVMWWWQGHLLPFIRRILRKLSWRMKWVGQRTCQWLPRLKRLKRLRLWWCTRMTSACRLRSPWRAASTRSSSPTFVCSTPISFVVMLATWPRLQTGWRSATTRSRTSPGH